MTLKEQSIATANALNDLALEMTTCSRDVPVRYIDAVNQHAEDLRKAADSHGDTATAIRDRMFETPPALDLLTQLRERMEKALQYQNAYDMTNWERELHRVIQAFVGESLKPYQKTLTDAVMMSANPMRFDMMPRSTQEPEADPRWRDEVELWRGQCRGVWYRIVAKNFGTSIMLMGNGGMDTSPEHEIWQVEWSR